MNNINHEIISKLKANLEGYWEYKYEVSSGSGFEKAETSRGGVMKVEISVDWTGLSAQINAQRLWGKRENEEAFSLDQEAFWEFFCKVTLRDGGILGFTSFIDDPYERAYTKTLYKTTEDFFLESGDFVYYRANKEIVEGKVVFRKIDEKAHLEWAPENIESSIKDGKFLAKYKTSSNDENLFLTATA